MDQTVEGKTGKKWYLRWWMWPIYVIGVIIVISSLTGSSDNTSGSGSPNSAPKPEAMKVESSQIINDYKDNGVAADAKYKNKLVEVSGVVDTIDKDILDTPYITLESYQYAIVDRIQCMFSKSAIAQLSAVSKGQQITLRGRVEGKLGNVIIRECEIVQ